ncbi:MAG: GTP-binding protein, partial [Clostridia bacterium]|nr:GTP-binding protein [Clostridia bacterium]
HHHHHAADVFTSWGAETSRKYTAEGIRAALESLDETRFGTVLRAKGIVAAEDGSWIHFDYVPGEPDVRVGGADVIGRLCVIGAGLDKGAISALFGLEA